MVSPEIQDNVKRHIMDKRLAERKLWIEYVKMAIGVLVFLVGVAMVTNYINIYFAVRYGFGLYERPWYSNFVLLLSIIAYIAVYFFVYRKLGFKITEKIDDLKTRIDSLEDQLKKER